LAELGWSPFETHQFSVFGRTWLVTVRNTSVQRLWPNLAGKGSIDIISAFSGYLAYMCVVTVIDEDMVGDHGRDLQKWRLCAG
jgi:hypothetical protein